MMTGWIFLLVLSNGTSVSTVSVSSGFATESACLQAAPTANQKARWACFKSSKQV